MFVFEAFNLIKFYFFITVNLRQKHFQEWRACRSVRSGPPATNCQLHGPPRLLRRPVRVVLNGLQQRPDGCLWPGRPGRLHLSRPGHTAPSQSRRGSALHDRRRGPGSGRPKAGRSGSGRAAAKLSQGAQW